VVRRFRVDSGTGVALTHALGPWASLPVVLLLAVAGLSLGAGRDRRSASARGWLAAALVLALVALCEVAARRLLAGAAPFARVSIGGGVWVAVFVAYALVVASRREMGRHTPAGRALGAAVPTGIAALLASGRLHDLGILMEYRNWADRFWTEVARHLAYAAISVGVAVVIGVGLGVLAYVSARSERSVFATVSLFQTIPGLAMIGILVGPFAWLSHTVPALRAVGFGGLGWAPVIVALTLYALLAIARNTYAGLAGVPPATVDAALGMGMTRGQVLTRVQLPLAMPVLFSGMRTAAEQTVGNATLGAFAAAGTLGLFVTQGLAEQSPDLVLLGAVALVVLALAVDSLMRAAQRLITPRHGGTEAVA